MLVLVIIDLEEMDKLFSRFLKNLKHVLTRMSDICSKFEESEYWKHRAALVMKRQMKYILNELTTK